MSEKEIKEMERESLRRKKEEVERITQLCKENKSFIITPILGIPADFFQELRGKFKGEMFIKVMKKNLIKRVLENLGINPDEIEEEISKPSAVIIANKDVFELAGIFEKNKKETYLKPGQVVEKEIVIEAGVTDLPAVAVAELSKAGLKVGVEKGKVAIKEKKVIKAGETISDALANALIKLDIKPVKIGFNVAVGIDLVNKKIYKNIVINKEEYLEKLQKAVSYAFNLAFNINYTCRETINALLQKAVAYANSLNKFLEGKK